MVNKRDVTDYTQINVNLIKSRVCNVKVKIFIKTDKKIYRYRGKLYE